MGSRKRCAEALQKPYIDILAAVAVQKLHDLLRLVPQDQKADQTAPLLRRDRRIVEPAQKILQSLVSEIVIVVQYKRPQQFLAELIPQLQDPAGLLAEHHGVRVEPSLRLRLGHEIQ